MNTFVNKLLLSILFSKYVWNNHVRYFFAILSPIFAIFCLAPLVITMCSMNQQGSQVNGVQIGNNRNCGTGHRHGYGYQNISQVIDFSSNTPKSTGEQFATSIGGNVLRWFTPNEFLIVTFELNFLVVGATK